MKDHITVKQTNCILFLYLLGNLFIFGRTDHSERDIGLAVILSVFLVLPLYFMYSRILSKNPDKNLFELLLAYFGRWIGRLFILLYLFYALIFTVMRLNSFLEFTIYEGMIETPKYFMGTFIILFCVFLAYSKLSTLGRFCEVLFPIVITLITLVIIVSIPYFHYANLQPFLYDGFIPVLKDTFRFVITPFGEAVILLGILSGTKEEGKHPLFLSKGLATIYIVLFLNCIKTVLIIGSPASNLFNYLSYNTLSVAKVGELLERFEIITSTTTVVYTLLTIGIRIIFISKAIEALFYTKTYRIFTMPISFTVLALMQLFFASSVRYFEFIKKMVYLTIPFQFVIPFFLFVMMYRKKEPINR